MRSAGSSSFWFAGRDENWRTEIDVYEIGGGARGFERKYNMNLHVFQTPTEKRHWNRGGMQRGGPEDIEPTSSWSRSIKKTLKHGRSGITMENGV